MEMNNVNPERPKDTAPVQKQDSGAMAKEAQTVKKAEAATEVKKEAAAPNPSSGRRYVAPDLSGNADLIRDMNKVNNDIKMLDLKRYGYEQDIQKIKAGLDENSKDFYVQLHEINSLRTRINSDNTERMQRIAQIKDKINAGEYKTDGMSVVEAIDKYRDA